MRVLHEPVVFCDLVSNTTQNLRSWWYNMARNRTAELVLKRNNDLEKLRVYRTIRLNYVCSLHGTSKFHYVQPLPAGDDPSATFDRLRDLLCRRPRIMLLETADQYIHAVCYSRIFRFPDDLKCLLCPEEQVIHISSASRYGMHDLGVNRARVEWLHRQLRSRSATNPG